MRRIEHASSEQATSEHDVAAGATTTPDGVGRQAAQGATWSGLAFVLEKAVVFAASAVLAHLLTPREFGLVAIAMVIVGYVERLSEGGLESAVITFPGSDRATVDHAVGLGLVLGLGFAAIGVATAPLVARTFDEPDVTPVVAALSVLYLTTSLRKVWSGVLARRLQFAKRVGPELARAAVKAVVMIGLAWQGYGVWALTLGHLAGAILGLVAYVLVVGERFRPRISFPTTSALFKLGGSFSLVSLLGTIVQNADYVMLGIRSDTADVGLYSMGFRIPELTVLALPVVASPALITAYSRVADSKPDLRAAYLQSLQLLAMVLIPVGAGLSLVADDALPLIFGDQWTASIPVVQLVGLVGIAAGLGFPLGDALKASNRAFVLVRLAFIRLAVTLPALWWAADRGLTMLAAAQLALAVSTLVMFAIVARRSLGATVSSQLSSLFAAAIAGASMAGAVLVLRSVMQQPGFTRLVASVVVGVTVYAAVLLLVDRKAVQRLLVFVPGVSAGTR